MTVRRNIPIPENVASCRAEMIEWDDERLRQIAYIEQNASAGIAAGQILDERMRRLQESRHQSILAELSKPQWKTPSFWLAAIAAVAGCIAAWPILAPMPGTQPSATNTEPAQMQVEPAVQPPQPAAPAQPGGSTPASSPPSKSPRSTQLRQ